MVHNFQSTAMLIWVLFMTLIGLLNPESRCERVSAEDFVRDALNALKFCKEYAECAE